MLSIARALSILDFQGPGAHPGVSQDKEYIIEELVRIENLRPCVGAKSHLMSWEDQSGSRSEA
jgi:hypothetical protein